MILIGLKNIAKKEKLSLDKTGISLSNFVLVYWHRILEFPELLTYYYISILVY